MKLRQFQLQKTDSDEFYWEKTVASTKIIQMNISEYKSGIYKIYQPGYNNYLKSISIDCTYKEYSFSLRVGSTDNAVSTTALVPLYKIPSSLSSTSMTNITCAGDIYKLPAVNCSNGVLNYYSLKGVRYIDIKYRIAEMAQQYKCLEIDDLKSYKTYTRYSSTDSSDFCYKGISENYSTQDYTFEIYCFDTLDISCPESKVIKSLKFIEGNTQITKVSDYLQIYHMGNIGIEYTCCEVGIAANYNTIKSNNKKLSHLTNIDYIFEGYEISALQKK